MARKKKQPEPHPFPDTLNMLIDRITAMANQEISRALSDTMGLLNLDPEKGWRGDVANRVFTKIEDLGPVDLEALKE